MSRFLVLVCFFAASASAQESNAGNGINFYSLEKEMALGRQLAAQFQRDTTPLVSPAALACINGIRATSGGAVRRSAIHLYLCFGR